MTEPAMEGGPVHFYDIVVVGAGPAGLMLSTCLARWGYRVKHLDNRPGPTKTGRADGIQPRSLDLLRNMRLKTDLMAHKPARVYEVAFWNPDQSGNDIVRTGTWATCPSFIDARYPFTTLIHQGHIENVFIHDLERNGVLIQRPWTITNFESDEEKNPEHPVRVELKHVDGTVTETVRAKYLFGGEGSKSFVRQLLNIRVKHIDPIQHVWGVMDGVVDTDFPDIKVWSQGISPIKIRRHGSIMVIPREDNMVRLYIQIASSDEPDWNPRKTAKLEQVQEAAKRILHPYKIDWERVEWYSVYPIGQGISDRYSLDQRVFLGGDACHTHSPKAGQGMNTAFLDALNLAWKIHVVEGGLAHRDLLKTYETERRGVAKSLLDFDNRYAKLFSQRPPAAKEVEAATEGGPAGRGDTVEDEFVKVFKESCEFTSGYGVAYGPNQVNWSMDHPAKSTLIQPEGTKLRTGHIFINSDVTRVVDANVVHLEQEVPLNGSFRIFIFAGNPAVTQAALQDLANGLGAKRSFYGTYARNDVDTVSHHEQHNPHSLFFTLCTIFATKRSNIEISKVVPRLLARYRDHIYADDRWDRRVPFSGASAHAKMGLDEQRGAVVVVRPDGYVGVIVSLVEGTGTVNALNEYFSAFCTKNLVADTPQL
ncbi:phenol 2-monooxygenase [Metarhizium album ARSEF 1941]|uniref:Phenol 2-monooxygenase n=1 Tax=Metarhizium album (strain ARSEF 1941) TaxID=1081103 RepID=A0A0B2WP64_METAS|nr:phenol 2-monooxygenase [Metarhizium album ARSEF 1941]KHN97831.1 phenol 2-monooxygenase [Metarhizium album ARSEF 1941]